MSRERSSTRDDDSRSTRGGRDEPRERSSSREREREEPRGRSSRDDSRDEPRGRGRDDDSRSERSSSRGGSSRGSSSGFQYQSRSAEDTRARALNGGNDFDKLLKPHIKSYKAADGDNRIRILPATWEGAKHFGLDVRVHYQVGADAGAYLDLHKMLGKDDPIHEEYLRCKNELDPDNKDDAQYLRNLKGTDRSLVYLIDRDHEKEGVQAWLMPQSLDNNIVSISQDKGTGEVLPIDHPEDGYDIEFTKTGKGVGTKYTAVAIARRSSPLGRDEWLDYAMDNPLPDVLNYYDYDHIAKAFGGGGAHKEKPRGRDEPRGGRDSGRDEPRGRSRDPEPRNDEPTWESIHEMTGKELDALVEQERLDINPDEAKDDADLADWICDEMKIKKTEKVSRERSSAKDDDDTEDRLRKMRAGRRD